MPNFKGGLLKLQRLDISDELVHERRHSIANALKLRLSCTNPSTFRKRRTTKTWSYLWAVPYFLQQCQNEGIVEVSNDVVVNHGLMFAEQPLSGGKHNLDFIMEDTEHLVLGLGKVQCPSGLTWVNFNPRITSLLMCAMWLLTNSQASTVHPLKFVNA